MAKRGGGFQGMPGNMQNIMKQAQRLQRQMEEAHASDEFYLLADRELPEAEW